MAMEPGSKQDGVVNMTRAMEALSPWLNHSRRTIIKVEALVVAAAVLLLLQLILGSCKRRWHNSFLKYGLHACNGIMFPLIVYTLGTMQSSPIKNSSYPVWAGFLIMASGGTTAVQQYDFCDSPYKKYIEFAVDFIKYVFYVTMFRLLIDPNTYTLKTALDLKRKLKHARTSSNCVIALVTVVLLAKLYESIHLLVWGYKKKGISLSITNNKSHGTQVAERMEESANDRAWDSDPETMKGYKYVVCYLPSGQLGFITIDQIWHSCDNSADGKALKDLSLSCALSQRLVRQCYFGEVNHKSSLLKHHDFVFKKLLSSQGDFKRAFRIIELELGFCYDFFFTKYYYTFTWMNVPLPFIQSLISIKIILILIVGVLAIRKSLVLETPNPIIEVHISEADYIITLLVLGIALIVELVQAALYLASNWAQVSLARMHFKKLWCEPNPYIFGKIIGYIRRVGISGQLMKNKINQYSIIFQHKQLDLVEVSDVVKRAVAGSLISKYGNYLTTNGETSQWQNNIFHEYSWAINGLSHLEVMLIWHIGTEYCDISDPTPSNQTTQCRRNKHRGFAANFSGYCSHFFGYVLHLLPNYRRNRITRDNDRGIAVHLSRYCAYLIGSVPELLPYHKADIARLVQKVMEERTHLFDRLSDIYDKMENLEGTRDEDDPRKIFQKGVKLGKQLKRLPDGDRWEMLKDFWAETIIHAAKSHYTTKQHMQRLENGGEFLTHIWALLAHAGILNLSGRKDEEDQGNLGTDASAAV